MNFSQKKLLANINSLFGSLLFVSDTVGDYGEEQLEIIKKTFGKRNTQVKKAEFAKKNVMNVEYIEDGIEHKVVFNIRSGKIYSEN